MAIKPILFNTEMVKAILEGRKTQTRRIVKKKYSNTDLVLFTNKYGTQLVERQNDVPPPIRHLDGSTTRQLTAICELKPPCNKGDILWVRETWCKDVGRYMYRANYADDEQFYRDGKEVQMRWSPSIHMPKEAARIFLQVKDVWVERLGEITLDDVHAEGIDASFTRAVGAGSPSGVIDFSAERFETLWDSTIKPADLDKYGWDANPWVWVIEFERCEKPEGWH
ncbi:MAG: hypothetical protein J6K72_08525 [Clostridia bacterium]|nr:hypothetical protein [Clostridia bacterium]